MFRAHELIANVKPSSQEYKDIIAAAKFDLGDMDAVGDMSQLSTKTFYEIPAPICLFQVTHEMDLHFFLAKHQDGGTVWKRYGKLISDGFRWVQEDIEFFVEPDGGNCFISRISTNTLIGLYKNPDGTLRKGTWDEVESEMTDTELWTLEHILGCAQAIEVFSCNNISVVDRHPGKHTNKARKKKGKIPFLSYKTLHIPAPKGSDNNLGSGSHASPRLHLRRGHIRRLANGGRTWVSSCLVGDKKKGFSGHNYAVMA